MPRRKDWLERLEAYVEATRREAFVWGQMDCALWAAGAVEAMTGEDPAAAWRGCYATREEATALLAERGFGSLAAAVGSRLEAVPVAQVRPGDVVELTGRTVGVVQGRFAWALTESRGVGLVPMEHAKKGFRV